MKCCLLISKHVVLTNRQCQQLITILDDLIVRCYVQSFWLGYRDDCHPVCCAIVMELQKKYPHIEVQIPSTIQSNKIRSKKNPTYSIIDDCWYCIFYYNQQQKGSKLAFEYAQKKKKVVMNLAKKD